MKQISLFDGTQRYIVDKPLRLIELFAGYGSQSLALKYLGVPFESWKTSEWAIPSIRAYKDLHHGDDTTDYSAGKTDQEITEWLTGRISSNYNEPLTYEQIKRLGEKRRREIYSAMVASHNRGSIVAIHGDDLAIEDTDKYTYIMFYSFPCQDLSVAGNGAGCAKGSGTRSGLLWEVERILDELHAADRGVRQLPQVLIAENVPALLAEKNHPDLYEWLRKLESLGYHNYYQTLNAKNYGIPQNRDRVFVVSILGDYYYDFPKTIKLPRQYAAFLRFDDNYIVDFSNANETQKKCMKIVATKIEKHTSKTIRTSGLKSRDRHEWACYSVDLRQSERFQRISSCIAKTICAMHVNTYTLDGRVYYDYSPIECFNLMGVKDQDYEKVAAGQSKSSMYHLAGDSIVTTVLMALFGQMLGIDWKTKVHELVDEITNKEETK